MAFKSQLVPTGLGKEGKEMETNTPTFTPEMLQLCVAKIIQEGWLVKSLDKAAYLQGKEIERVVYLKPSKEAN